MVRPLVIAFLAIALATGLPLAVMTPPGHVPDESEHAARADGLLLGQVVGHRMQIPGPFDKPVVISGVLADPAMLAVAAVLPTERPISAEQFRTLSVIPWFDKPMFMAIGGIATYLPIFYAPAALALGVAKLIGLSPYIAFLAGRTMNLACFMLVGAIALAIARRGRAVNFCVLTCPMTLSLAASFNEDGLLIASAALAAALLSRIEPTRRGPNRDHAFAALIIAAVAAVKPPYMALAGLMLLPVPAFRSWRAERRAVAGRIGVMALVVLPGLLWTAWMLASVATPVPRMAYAPGPLWHGDPDRLFDATDVRAQLAVLGARPGLLLTLPWSYFTTGVLLPREMVGVLGWLTIDLPDALYRFWYAAIGLAFVADAARAGSGPSGWRDTLLAILMVAVAAWGIALIEYLTWTNVGGDHIEGVQGRYLLPLIPFLAIAIPGLPIPRGRVVAACCMIGPISAAVAGVAVLPLVILGVFYVH